MKKRYGKLVRDNVPEHIRSNGEVPNTRVLDSEEYRRELLYKLIEEAEELRQAGFAPTDDEFRAKLADVAEVVDALMIEFTVSEDELSLLQEKKRSEKGGFKGKVFLESVQ